MWSREDLSHFADYVGANSQENYNFWGRDYNPTFNGIKYKDYGLGYGTYMPFNTFNDYRQLLASNEVINPEDIDLNAVVNSDALNKFKQLVYDNKELLGINGNVTVENAAN